ncbi:hypothetical protein EMIHUDRAFT_114135 [Emiliania huxleyi CCMP1516]|uniref:Pyrrolo-quinoline quinone repeat domain-containing protein n=2 Tax=Emiliania huxleyi TaxID=2903 RepID=A0A0D3JYN4_EMIH1|nr:hypothetical protein EMIHUDRAFT_114135 [Emiliania huxleyi CCMP1516]EOD28619.1 hypothetical protein EMIHUDRAFT_114135 [Emiliania huxleyi CCMP1516]|eukprot:XP_005781048.1 hypothetical protein EMIHUDRAFT_114135 [Emiliania huxleyi CCMP1516]
MLKNSELSASAYSQGAWRRELGLTLYAGQHLPGQLYGGNSLELYHPASGVRISFCALEALRSWAGLDCAPVPHLSPSAPLPAWDYTFTTAYPGAVAVAPPGAGVPSQPDGTTFYARAAVDLADGPARLRRPLCKCRGASGRPPLVPVSDPHPLADCEPAPPSPPPPPRWRRAAEELDLASLLREDNLDPQSRSTLRVRVVCTGSLLLASLRCFVRVNGVAARVVDTRYLLRPDSVLRARSWREGRWAELAGEGAPSHVDLGPDEDSLAAARLPVVRPPLTELLRLPTAARPGRGGEGGGEGGGGGRGGRGRGLGGAALEPRWRRAFGGELEGVSVDGTRVVVAHSEGGVERLELSGGGRLWLSALRHGAAAAAVALSPSEADGGRLAVGGRGGEVEVWRAESGDLLASVSVVPAGPRRAVAVSNWVEWLSWRGDGGALGCAAGRCVALLSSGGEVVARREASGQVAALAFVAGEFKRVDEAAEAGAGWRGRLAVGTYGGVEWLCAGGAPAESLALGGGAVRCLAVSPSGGHLAAGCLDKRAHDWIGFDGPVRLVAWSGDGAWLAAVGGSQLLAVPTALPAGESPVLCCSGRVEALVWGPARHPAHWLLATLETSAARVYDMRLADGAAPRRVAPVAAVSLPGLDPRGASPSISFGVMAGGEDTPERSLESDGSELLLVVTRGSGLEAVCLTCGTMEGSFSH